MNNFLLYRCRRCGDEIQVATGKLPSLEITTTVRELMNTPQALRGHNCMIGYGNMNFYGVADLIGVLSQDV